MSTFRITMSDRSILTRIEMDGVERHDVTTIDIHASVNGVPSVTLTLIPDAVEVTGPNGLVQLRRASRWERLRGLLTMTGARQTERAVTLGSTTGTGS